MKKFDIFLIFVQNIDFGYMLESNYIYIYMYIMFVLNQHLRKKNMYIPLHTPVSLNEPPHGKTNNLHRRKQRRRSASR